MLWPIRFGTVKQRVSPLWILKDLPLKQRWTGLYSRHGPVSLTHPHTSTSDYVDYQWLPKQHDHSSVLATAKPDLRCTVATGWKQPGWTSRACGSRPPIPGLHHKWTLDLFTFFHLTSSFAAMIMTSAPGGSCLTRNTNVGLISCFPSQQLFLSVLALSQKEVVMQLNAGGEKKEEEMQWGYHCCAKPCWRRYRWALQPQGSV